MNAAMAFAHRYDGALAQALAWSQPDWLRRQRGEAYARFQALGLPTTRQEDWKYTSLTGLERATFTPPERLPAAHLRHTVFDALAQRLVFVDGGFRPEASTLRDLPEGVTLMPLSEALLRRSGAGDLLQGEAAADADAMASFNRALWRDGVYLEIAPGVELPEPLHLFCLGTPGHLAPLHHLLVLGQGSRATVIEHTLSEAEAAHFTNAMTDCRLAAGAELTHVKLTEEGGLAYHIGGTVVQLAAGSRYVNLSITAGSLLARNDLVVTFEGEDAACTLNGLTLGRGRRHVDHHTFIDHRRPRCTSRQLYKGVLDDRSRAVFNGRVRVAEGAVGTDARQLNRNLLLSPAAEADSKPQLEIFADDVKCSHGAAVGSLDAGQLYYLRTRGLAETEARALLLQAYAAEVFTAIPASPLRTALETWLRGALPGSTHTLTPALSRKAGEGDAVSLRDVHVNEEVKP